MSWVRHGDWIWSRWAKQTHKTVMCNQGQAHGEPKNLLQNFLNPYLLSLTLFLRNIYFFLHFKNTPLHLFYIITNVKICCIIIISFQRLEVWLRGTVLSGMPEALGFHPSLVAVTVLLYPFIRRLYLNQLSQGYQCRSLCQSMQFLRWSSA